jgi:hypothetical protein
LISIILTASDDAKSLARLLTGLVPAAADGLVREVAVLGATGDAALVADDAGAELYEAGAFAEAFGKARGPWVAGFPLNCLLTPDWMEVLAAHLSRDVATATRLTVRNRGFLRQAPEGWLVPKRVASAGGVAEQDLQRLARLGGGRGLRILGRR